MNTNAQNATLMITTVGDESECYHLTYVPLHIDSDTLEYILNHGQSDNMEAITFDIDCDHETYWSDMWNQLKGETDNA